MKDATDADRQVRETLQGRADSDTVNAKLDLVDEYGQDNHIDGTVLRFTKTLPVPSSRADTATRDYTYVVLKAGSRWYPTGPKQAGLMYWWWELLAWLVSGEHPVRPQDVQIAAHWAPLGQPIQTQSGTPAGWDDIGAKQDEDKHRP